ncbi:MAG: bifunctional hydroxymethylpyrimidine kinase/phosphomethylpyrimidine kinase [Gemmatimonadota bacterium]|nr:bifunctional hydroxymethylpyrimidine kinase/phosphomethylpyrimidine kinase [Gemmatimonadota bacterium]MDH5760282.1 bifunctional hydroxymethylpyrimidine kinase/phosphomethylpyrimidine kinase [Gemmatimonadota bacterium]
MDTPTPILPVVLSIAGSDSGGGAGIQADLKTFHAFHTFGTSVVTAVTAQNTLGVTAVHTVPLDVVVAQFRAVADDLPPAACKTGMLATSDLVRTVAEEIRSSALPNLVVDPVMVATSGDRLLDEEAEGALRTTLLPLAALVTPNLHEARILTGLPVDSVEDMLKAARALTEMGARAALVKGGHLDGDAVDVLWDGQHERVWRHPRVRTPHTHGTGCTLSAAITAGLGRGHPLETAVDAAVSFISRAIATAPGLGAGHGPVNHFAPVD